MSDSSALLQTIPTILIVLLVSFLSVGATYFSFGPKNRIPVTIGTLLSLVLPVLSMWGLYLLTEFAFSDAVTVTEPTKDEMDVEEGFSLTDIKTWWISHSPTGGSYSKDLTSTQMQAIRVAIVSLWILLPVLIISWVGKVSGMWCFF